MAVFGAAAMIVSLTIVLVGLPAQILRNARRKSADGISPLLILCTVLTYSLWSLYAWTKPDWYLAAAQTPGAVISAILVGQYAWYTRKRRIAARLTGAQVGVLATLYPPDAVFVDQVRHVNPVNQSIIGRCRVPEGHAYTHVPVPYVTAEEYTRCISQLSYLLVAALVQDGRTTTSIATLEEFLARMRSCTLWYRKCDLHYRRQVRKGEVFELTLTLTGIRGLPSAYTCDIEVRSVPLHGRVQFASSRTAG